MDLGLNGKVALVAAATQGIGFATARELLAEGCKVSICGRKAEGLAKALEALVGDRPELAARVHGQVADVGNAEQIHAWIAAATRTLGVPQILVTNTGGPPASAPMATTDEQWQAGFESTLLNVVRMVREVAPAMKQTGWGRIVHITSLVAREPSMLLTISSTLRTGLHSLTRLQARELGPFGITVNAVLPGHTLTSRQTHLAEIEAARDGKTVAEVLRQKAGDLPVGHLADPSEIAAVIAFLCSARASFVTGESVLADGGGVRGL